MALDTFVRNCVLPATIKIVSKEVCSRISMNHSIHIDHRDYHKRKFFEKFKSQLILRRKESNHMITNKRPNSFAGMLPSSQQYDFFAGVFTFGNMKAGNRVSDFSFPSQFHRYFGLRERILDLIEKTVDFSEGVGRRGRKVDSLSCSKLIFKVQAIVGLGSSIVLETAFETFYSYFPLKTTFNRTASQQSHALGEFNRSSHVHNHKLMLCRIC